MECDTSCSLNSILDDFLNSDIDPILRSNLDQFLVGINYLESRRNSVDCVELSKTSNTLNNLNKSIHFDLGIPSETNREVFDFVTRVFSRAVGLINKIAKIFSEENIDTIKGCVGDIESRIEELKESCPLCISKVLL